MSDMPIIYHPYYRIKAVYLHATPYGTALEMIRMQAAVDAKDGFTDLLADILGVA